LKVLHVPYCYFPDPVGGTEIYVSSLSEQLIEQGLESVVAAPAASASDYEFRGVRVRRFGVSDRVEDVRVLYGEGDPHAAEQFATILEEEFPDVAHFHAFTPAVSLRLVREVKRRGIPVVFTYHTPTVSCVRGTLARWGTTACDGRLQVRRCAPCALHGRGLGRAASIVAGSLPATLGRLIGRMGFAGRWSTGLRMSELVELRHQTFRALVAEVDHIIALCQWTLDLLVLNGVPRRKISLCRHGLPHRFRGDEPSVEQDLKKDSLRVAFLGRYDATKGADVLVRTLRSLPGVRLEAHLYGIVQGSAEKRYEEGLIQQAAGDPRIAFLPPIPSDAVITALKNYDLVAVPSQCLETGPLVVLEAFAAGVPVIGSNLGGIAEQVRHNVDGLLVEAASVSAWRAGIKHLAESPAKLTELRGGVRPPRHMSEVAREMSALYPALSRVARSRLTEKNVAKLHSLV